MIAQIEIKQAARTIFIGFVPDQDGIKVASSTLAVAVMAAAFQFNEFSFIPIKFQAWNKLRK